MNKKFISIIWGYHEQMFVFEKEQNYHMSPIDLMNKKGYECEIFAIDSKVRIENDPNFVVGTKVHYYSNIFQYLSYLFFNREEIIYSNSLTLRTLIVGMVGKNTFFMSHDQALPLEAKKIKRKITIFFYRFFSCIRVINLSEQELLSSYNIKSTIVPLSISSLFYKSRTSIVFSGQVLFLGNLTFDKNPFFLLETVEKLATKNIKLCIHIFGEDRIGFQEKVQEQHLDDFFVFHGFVSQKILQEWIGKTDIYINTSLSEGQCLAVYEAALAGNILCLPYILSFPSVFGENALYHRSSEELFKNIQDICTHPARYKKSVERNQTMILKDYNTLSIDKKMGELFSESRDSQDIRRAYNSKAALDTYGTKNGLSLVEEEIFSRFPVKSSILDIGCGAGRTTQALYEKGYKRISAFDFSPRLIQAAREKYPHIASFFSLGDVTNLDFQKESFDIAFFSFNGIDYLPSQSQRFLAYENIHKVLKKNGFFVFSSHNRRCLPNNRVLLKTWMKNIFRIFSWYWITEQSFGTIPTFYSSPEKIEKEMSLFGFQKVKIYPHNKILFPFFDTFPYYVYQKK